MNEKFNTPDSEGDTQPPSLMTAGAILRSARESAGLHVAALAVSMKVPVKKLEALEADRLDLLPDVVFVRALASSVCRALKIDPKLVLSRLPQTATPRLDAEGRGINAPFRSTGESAGISVPAYLAKPTVLVVLALLIGALIIVFYPTNPKPGPASEAAMFPPVSAIPSANIEEPKESSTGALLPVPTSPVPAAVHQDAPEVSATLSAPVSLGAPQMPSEPTVSTTVKPDPQGPAVDLAKATTGTVTFKVRGPSWVEVTDAKGVVQLRKTMSTGEVAAASGVAPLSVVVGRADVTDVQVRGALYSTAAIVKDNVARFEVK